MIMFKFLHFQLHLQNHRLKARVLLLGVPIIFHFSTVSHSLLVIGALFSTLILILNSCFHRGEW